MSEQETSVTSSPKDPPIPLPWWVRLCHRLWKIITFLGTAVILGAVASLIATWLTSPNGVIPVTTPLRYLFAQWPITLSVGCGLLLLTLLIWVLSHWPNAGETSPSLAQQNRDRMLRRLR